VAHYDAGAIDGGVHLIRHFLKARIETGNPPITAIRICLR